MPTLEEFVTWQGEKPKTRTVDIDIDKKGVRVWVYDTSLMIGQFVESVGEINLAGEIERRERQQYALLKAKYEGTDDTDKGIL